MDIFARAEARSTQCLSRYYPSSLLNEISPHHRCGLQGRFLTIEIIASVNRRNDMLHFSLFIFHYSLFTFHYSLFTFRFSLPVLPSQSHAPHPTALRSMLRSYSFMCDKSKVLYRNIFFQLLHAVDNLCDSFMVKCCLMLNYFFDHVAFEKFSS